MTISTTFSRRAFMAMMLGTTAACATTVPMSNPEVPAPMAFTDGYGPVFDSRYNLPSIPPEYTQGINRRMSGVYLGEAPANSIDVDPYAKFLYHVKGDGTAVRYPVGVGRAGKAFSGNGIIQVKKKWPGWTPTANMLRTEPEIYGPFRRGIPGGLRSPLGRCCLVSLPQWSRHILPDPRHQCAGLHRELWQRRLYPHVQPRHHPPLQCR